MLMIFNQIKKMFKIKNNNRYLVIKCNPNLPNYIHINL